jgi:hypothetical protein
LIQSPDQFRHFRRDLSWLIAREQHSEAQESSSLANIDKKS